MSPCNIVAPILCLAFTALAPAPELDIHCEESGRYIGGLDRIFTLKIDGPEKKTWHYTFKVVPSDGRMDLDMKGTYELKGGLAVFTGKADKEELRFGINYGFPGGKVEFNGFFPDGDKTLRYHRQWFAKIDGTWQPTEEINVTMPLEGPSEKSWAIALTREHTLWSKDGKKTTEKFKAKVIYEKREGRGEYVSDTPLPGLPATIYPRWVDKKLAAVTFWPEQGGTGGVLRGFQPRMLAKR